jgi:hypothetical protein
MKKLHIMVFIALLVTSCRSTSLAGSFKQAAALGDAQEKEPAVQAFLQRDLEPYYQKKYSSIFQSCLASTDHPDTSSFSFVAAIGKDGRVLRVYIDRETTMFDCARQTLQQDEFPRPPLSPYYFHVSMTFSK